MDDKKKEPISTLQLLQAMDAALEQQVPDQALTIARHIFAQQPRSRDAWERVTMVFMDAHCLPEAEEAIQVWGRQFSADACSLFLQCRLDYMQLDYEAAIAHGERALALDALSPVQSAMAHNLLGHIYRVLGQLTDSLRHFERAGQKEYTADGPADLMHSLQYQDYSNYLFTLHYTDCSQDEMLAAARRYGAFFQNIKPYTHRPGRHRHTRLRIGYISPDLRRHVVAFFSYAFFKAYDREAFAVYAYANNQEDRISREYAAGIDCWRNIRGQEPAVTARRIYDDEIDILVDLAGHTADNCLPVLAYKPAPVQVSGIGWFDTTGLDTVDYFLADPFTDPVGENETFFTEQLLRLPHSHLCYRQHDTPPSVEMSAYRRNGYVTFGSFNNFAKVTDAVLGVWSRILAAVPHSRLLLKAKIINIPYGRRLVRQRIQAAGIPLERVFLQKHESEYLLCYRDMDIALDTWPYPGGGTTCDALYMGVPVITLAGERHNSRFGYSILQNAGLGDLCADSLDEYVLKAVALAADEARLSDLHQTLRCRLRQSPVMDAGLYMAELEDAYRTIWQHWLKPTETATIVSLETADAGGAFKRGMKFYVNGGEAGSRRALCWFQRACELAPERYEPWLLLSEAAHQVADYGRAYHGAQAAVQRLKKIFPEGNKELSLTINCRLGAEALSAGDYVNAFDAYCEAWKNAEAGNQRDRLNMFDSMLLTAHYLDFSSQDIYELHRLYAREFTAVMPYHYAGPYRHDKIRIGYISADFCNHVMFSFLYGLVTCYDRRRFEVTCYHMRDKEDYKTEFIRSQVDSFVNVAKLTLAEAAKRIHDDEMDVLVDLAGHSSGTGLPVLAWRPAPLQLSGLGYMATTGLLTVDYFITDPIVDPPGQHEACFTEQLLYLPSQFSYAWPGDVPEPQTAPCLKRGYVVFGVFNHYRKLTDEMLQVWRRILQRVPTARLLLKAMEYASDSLVLAAYQRFQQLGFDMERVVFEPSSLDYMKRYLDVDIALDTYPYPGGGTTMDSLYMGVPVVTLYGERRNTRFGLSILQNIGLEDLAVASGEDYEERAVALAQDTELLELLHLRLRQMLQNTHSIRPDWYTQHFEQRLLDILAHRRYISACYIVRDEAAQLARSLESLQHGYDELIVVDTGSTDDTIRVAKSYGAAVAAYSWQDDFAAARNFALDQCHGDWVVFLDADEYFPAGQSAVLRTTIEAADRHGKRALLLKRKDIDQDRQDELQASSYVLRIFRRETALRYEGAIHEQLRDHGGDIDGVMFLPDRALYLMHTGYSSSISQAKARRNLRILQQELAGSSQPGRWYGFLADAYWGLDDRAMAEKYARLDIRQGRRAVTYASRSWRILLQLLAKEAGSRATDRQEAAETAAATFPEIPEFHAEYAECLAAAGQYRAAVDQARMAQQAWQDYQGIEPVLFSAEMAEQLQARAGEWQRHLGGRKLSQPLTSIMIPTYNRPDLLEQTLQSCLNQDTDNLEILVCDNSTNDATASMIRKYLGDPRLSYHWNQAARSKADNFRPFETLARGEYLQWLMDDDMLAPAKIRRMSEILMQQPAVTLVTSQRGVVNADGLLLGCREAPFAIEGDYRIISGAKLAMETLPKAQNFLGEPSAVLFRRRDLIHHYWAAESRGYQTISDVAMWLELLEHGDGVIFREPLSYYRKHENQEGQQPDVLLLSRIEWVRLNRDYYQRQVFPYAAADYRRFLQARLQEHVIIARSLQARASRPMWLRYLAMLDWVKNEL